MSQSRPVLVIGGTRGTGLLVARLLAERGVPVRVLARDPTRARRVLGPEVQVAPGDITQQHTLLGALEDVEHVVFTAGCRAGRPATEAKIRATEFCGVLSTLVAMQVAGTSGRFLYMTSSGVFTRSLFAMALNRFKGNTLVWRGRAEKFIRASSFDYTIIRAGVLLNRPGGLHPIMLTQEALPLSLRHRIARADVAAVFVAALGEPRATRATFDVVWAGREPSVAWADALRALQPDERLTTPAA